MDSEHTDRLEPHLTSLTVIKPGRLVAIHIANAMPVELAFSLKVGADPALKGRAKACKPGQNITDQAQRIEFESELTFGATIRLNAAEGVLMRLEGTIEVAVLVSDDEPEA